MRKLISMTDYVLERSDKSILQYTISETFKNGAKITNEIFEYAKFLKTPLTISMFIPCDKTGNVLNEVKEFDNSVGSDENYNRALRNYKIAKENVLFKGFSIKERNCNSSFFKYIENGFIAVYYFNEKFSGYAITAQSQQVNSFSVIRVIDIAVAQNSELILEDFLEKLSQNFYSENIDTMSLLTIFSSNALNKGTQKSGFIKTLWYKRCARSITIFKPSKKWAI